MGVSDSGSWKLLIYPLIIIAVIGGLMNIVIKPFVDSGIPAPSEPQVETTQLSMLLQGDFVGLNNVTNGTATLSGVEYIFFWIIGKVNSVTFGLPANAGIWIGEQLNLFSYLPSWIALPLEIILIVCVIYALYVLATMLIP